MPTRSSEPPRPMTWGRALPVLVVAVIFDAARVFFDFFVFSGPALAAVYCASKLNEVLGSVAGTAICTASAGVVGFVAAAPLETFGIFMAMALGIAGWVVIGGWILIGNRGLITANAAAALWMGGSLALAVVPLVNAIPGLTITLWRLYRTQIRVEKKNRAAYQKAQAEKKAQEAAARERQAIRQAAAQAEMEAEVANDPLYAVREPEEVDEALAQGEQRHLTSMPDSTPEAMNEPQFSGRAPYSADSIPAKPQKAA